MKSFSVKHEDDFKKTNNKTETNSFSFHVLFFIDQQEHSSLLSLLDFEQIHRSIFIMSVLDVSGQGGENARPTFLSFLQSLASQIPQELRTKLMQHFGIAKEYEKSPETISITYYCMMYVANEALKLQKEKQFVAHVLDYLEAVNSSFSLRIDFDLRV